MEPASGIALTGVTGVAAKSADIATAKTLLSNFIVFLPGSAFRLLLERHLVLKRTKVPFVPYVLHRAALSIGGWR